MTRSHYDVVVGDIEVSTPGAQSALPEQDA